MKYQFFIISFFAILFISACSNKNQELKKPDSETSNGFTHPEWSKKSTIYEVNVRQFTKEGTFKAFDKHFERLNKMGVDILWFMPVHPIGEKNRKGEMGSYYSVNDYRAINPSFGTMEDFKNTVKKAHSLGMHVIIDWVANHSAWDNQWTVEHPEWYKKDSIGGFVSPYDWTDVIALDFENKDLWDGMIDAMKFWLEETDIDGFRCDVAGMVKVEFWNKAKEELDKIKPVFMLAEAEEPVHHEKAFDMSYGWEFHHIMNKIAQEEMNITDIDKYFAKQDTMFPADAYRMHFTSNHDENSWNGTEYERLGDATETFAVISATIPGMLLIYSGQEAALDKRLEFFEKDEISWEELKLEKLYTSLIELKEANRALWNGQYGGNYKKVKSDNEQNIYVFSREKDNNSVIVITN